MIKRKRYAKIPVQGNVYPVPTLMYIEDEASRVNVLTGQSLGGASPLAGVMDIFLDRQLLQDDQRGMGQGVTDNRQTRLSFKLMMEQASRESLKPSLTVQQELHSLLNPVHLLESRGDFPIKGTISLFQTSLPCDVHVMNFRTCLFSPKYHLTLHRFAVTCASRCDSPPFFTASEVLHDKLLSKLSSSLTQTSLSHSETIRDKISLTEQLLLHPMEIVVYEFSHKNSSFSTSTQVNSKVSN